jgi:hypothetical protein
MMDDKFKLLPQAELEAEDHRLELMVRNLIRCHGRKNRKLIERYLIEHVGTTGRTHDALIQIYLQRQVDQYFRLHIPSEKRPHKRVSLVPGFKRLQRAYYFAERGEARSHTSWGCNG